MDGKRFVTTAALTAAFGCGAASATMHPELGAKLSGMGMSGVVNLQSNTTKDELCWTFTLAASGITGRLDPRRGGDVDRQARIDVRQEGLRDDLEDGTRRDRSDARLLPRLGRHEELHPGDLRGTLFAGMAEMGHM